VSFVRKRFKHSVVTAQDTDCFYVAAQNTCVEVPYGTSHSLEASTVTGVEYQSFRPFTTIKNRAQIGLTWGAGVGKVEGTAKGLQFSADGTTPDARPTKDIFPVVVGYPLPVTPIVRAELSAAVLVAPRLKVRASGGFNFPGYELFNLSVVYFFGPR
jgi:hypothetical protein